ncbi:hypothetical protein LX36DRAFT_123405 [Colletotrichum falcatum]|nr:hypothetical protein LX36DRAFT_123405 [Colletotrichum falcatum]
MSKNCNPAHWVFVCIRSTCVRCRLLSLIRLPAFVAASNSNRAGDAYLAKNVGSNKRQLSLEKHGPFSVSASMCVYPFFPSTPWQNKLGDGSRVVLGDSHSIRLRPRRDTEARGSLSLCHFLTSRFSSPLLLPFQVFTSQQQTIDLSGPSHTTLPGERPKP